MCVSLFPTFSAFRLAGKLFFSSSVLLLLCFFSIITKNTSQNLISSYIMSLWVDKYRPIELNQCEHVNASVANHLKELVKDGDCPHCASFSSLLLGNFQTLFFFCVLFKILSFSFSFSLRARFFFKSRTLLYVYPRWNCSFFATLTIYSSFLSFLQCCFTVRRVLGRNRSSSRSWAQSLAQALTRQKSNRKRGKSTRRLREKLKSI